MPPKKKRRKKKNKCKTYLNNCRRRVNQNPALRRIKMEWCELDFTNKMILIIGSFLLFELLTSIFWWSGEDTLSIHAIFRSSLAAVLGFVCGGMTNNGAKPEPALPIIDDAGKDLPEGACAPDTITIYGTRYLRTAIAGFVCLSCILILTIALIIHSIEGIPWVLTYKDGLIQIRSILSTTLGFLVSNSNNK